MSARLSLPARTLGPPLAVLAAATALILVLWLVLLTEFERDRATILRNTEVAASNLSRAFEEHVFQAARRVDQALKHFRLEYERDPKGFAERALALKDQLYPDLGFQLGFIDAHGMMQLSSFQPAAKPVDLSDREHYKVHKATAEDRLFISKPLLGRVTNKWTIQFTRPVRKPDGSFGGVLVLSIAPDYFSDFYRTIDLGKEGAITLVGMDRVIRARASGSGNPAGLGSEIPADRPFLDPAAPRGGIFVAPSFIDGVQRIAAYRRMEELPLVVVVLLSEQEVLAAFHGSRQSAVAMAAAVSVALLLAALMIAFQAYRRAQARQQMDGLRLRLIDAQRIASLGNWEWDIQTGTLWWSEEVYAIFGLTADGISPTYDSFMAAVHPDDRALVQAGVDKAIAEGGCHALDHRVLRPDGSHVVVHERGEVQYAADGTPLGMRGTVQDVTAERRREAELRKLWRAIEVVPAGVVITDRNGAIEFANPAQLRSTGYAADEVLGQTPRVFKSGAHDDAFYEHLWQTITSGHEWRGEIKNRCKDGHSVWEDMVISPVFGTDGEVVNFIAVKMDITEKKQMREHIETLAYHDALTGLPNRRMFQQQVDFAETLARRDGRSLALLYLDLDGFKPINDSLGHEAGDALLRLVAERLNQCARDGDTVARIGGDEFAISLSLRADARREAQAVAERILRVLDQPFSIDGHSVQVGASIGIALFPDSAPELAECLRLADQAMYAAKHHGKNCCVFCDEIAHLDKTLGI